MTNKKKSKAAKATKKAAEPKTPAAPETIPHRNQGLSQAQLTALIFMSIGASYVIDYGRVVLEGADTKSCSKYYADEVEACSPADIIVIKAKYYASISCLVLVAAAMLLCWTHEPLFQSLNALLCISPLGATIVAAYSAESAIKMGMIYKLFMTTTILLTVALSSIYKAELARPVTSRISSLQHVCLFFLGLVSFLDAIGLLNGGVEGYANVNPTDVSSGTTSLFSFLALDKITVSLLMLFVNFFFDENRKRSMLLFVAMTRVGELLLQLPKIENDLRDADGARSMLIGSAIFAGIAAFTPSLKWKKE